MTIIKNRYTKLLEFIKEYEVFVPSAYKPTPNDVWTIGYGFTKNVRPGDTITQKEADKRLKHELVNDYEKPLLELLHAHKISLKDHQVDALLSLVYNIGIPAFRNSFAFEYLKGGDYVRFLYEAFDKNAGFVKQGSNVLNGLVSRRHDEANIFINAVYERT